MHILLIGSGGREHAFAHQLKKSSKCDKLFIMPGNAGTAQEGINVPINPLDFAMVGKFCIDNEIGLLIVGPEEPLVKGLRNFFMADDKLKLIPFVGPTQEGAIIEGSKDWSKTFMQKYNIPTAAYRTFTFETIHEGVDYIKQHSLPIVLKADGLAAGKGVLICESHEEAITEFQLMLREQKFGAASAKVVVEAFMKGIELSVFVLTDGSHYKILPEAKDYKRIGEGDTGLNTGGMGAISPVPFADVTFMNKIESRIIIPTIHGLKEEKIDYKGFIFIGIMNMNNEPFVVEYNCRMGDPETEVVLPRMNSDLADLLLAAATGTLADQTLSISNHHAATVMMVAGGYPETYAKGDVITGLENDTNVLVFHAGTTKNTKGEIITSGGRVIALTSLGENLHSCIYQSLQVAEKINFNNKYYRSDIGYEFK